MADNGLEPRFCTACGKPLTPGARFCAVCGVQVVAPQARAIIPEAPVPAAPAPAPAQPAPVPAPAPSAPPAPAPAAPAPASGERVLAIVPNANLRAGFMGVKRVAYTLVLTDTRVIFARLTNEMLKQAVADARDDAKTAGKGFFGQWGAQMQAAFTYAQRYLSMDPAAALAETAENFAVDRHALSKIKFKAGLSGDTDTGDTPDVLRFDAGSQTYKFDLGNGISQAKDAFRTAGIA